MARSDVNVSAAMGAGHCRSKTRVAIHPALLVMGGASKPAQIATNSVRSHSRSRLRLRLQITGGFH